MKKANTEDLSTALKSFELLTALEDVCGNISLKMASISKHICKL